MIKQIGFGYCIETSNMRYKLYLRDEEAHFCIGKEIYSFVLNGVEKEYVNNGFVLHIILSSQTCDEIINEGFKINPTFIWS